MRIPTLAITAALLAHPLATSAQEEEFAGWQHQILNPGAESYTAPGNAAVIMLGTTPIRGEITEDAARQAIDPLLRLCPPDPALGGSTMTNDGFIRHAGRATGADCVALFRIDAGQVHSALLMSVPAQLAGNEALMHAALARRVGRTGATVPRAETAAAPAGPAPNLPSTDELLATLARVPPEARPVGVVAPMNFSPLSGLEITPWFLFGNGVAIAGDCAAYIPLEGPPSMALAEHEDCDARQWSGPVEQPVMTDRDGDEVSEDIPNGTIGGFARRQAVDLDVVTRSHMQTGMYDGATTVTSVSRVGRLRLAPDGGFSGSAARSIQSVGGLVFERPNNWAQAFQGRYAVEGFLIAIADPAGGVAIKPIGLLVEDGDSILYYEGDAYMRDDG